MHSKYKWRDWCIGQLRQYSTQRIPGSLDQVAEFVTPRAEGVGCYTYQTCWKSSWCKDTQSSAVLLQELHKERPSLKLLYVTPEQLVASTALIEALQELRRRELLPRFVVDEVWHPLTLHSL